MPFALKLSPNSNASSPPSAKSMTPLGKGWEIKVIKNIKASCIHYDQQEALGGREIHSTN
jgi:hypothetical protein